MSSIFRMLANETHDGEDEFADIVTVTGLMGTVAVGYFGKLRGNHNELIHTMSFKIIPSFACGALLATAVFLVIPDSLALLGGGHSDDAHGEEEHHEEGEEVRLLRRFLEEDEDHHEEHDEGNEVAATWKFGASLLSGFLFPILLHVFFPERDHILEEDVKESLEEHDKKHSNTNNNTNDMNEQLQQSLDEEETSDKSPTTTEITEDISPTKQKPIDWTLACSILVGDFFHNFTDGVFVGTAFLLCDRNVGYTIVATTIYHELAQEIADFALLHHHCGLPAWRAVLYNFLSGFSVMIGALVILSFDLSETAQGVTLAIAAGIYIYIAACECVPRIQAVRKGPKDTLLFLAFFVLGAIPIGLVLLNHNHCEGNHDEEDEEHSARMLF